MLFRVMPHEDSVNVSLKSKFVGEHVGRRAMYCKLQCFSIPGGVLLGIAEPFLCAFV